MLQSRLLTAADIGWIMGYAHEVTTHKQINDAMKCVNISFALSYENNPCVIIVIMIGSGKHYVPLLWTDGSYRGVKWAMLFFKELAKKEVVLFHSMNCVAKNHRITVNGEKSNRVYYKAVV